MNKFIIKDIRQEKQISLKQISIETKISISYLSEIENNKVKDPSFSKICSIATALGEDLQNIFFDTDEISSVQNILELYINRYGLMNEKTQEISKVMDGLVIKKMNMKK